MISTGSGERTYLLHIPPGYRQDRQMPVVLNFHGGGGFAAAQVELSGMNPFADTNGFIVAYPEGIQAVVGRLETFNAGDCCGRAERLDVDDVSFSAAILDDLQQKLCIDPKRVYATGMSNGAMMSYRLACELSGRVAAIAPVAGDLVFDNCQPDRPVPVMHFHGTADQRVPYSGGEADGLVFPSVSSTISFWVKNNGCLQTPAVTYQKGEVTCETYNSCQENAEVTLCTIENGGHTWPGGQPYPLGGKTSNDISASERMLEFFLAHPMP
jgi:polyhydroxybutyrate depolymerase